MELGKLTIEQLNPCNKNTMMDHLDINWKMIAYQEVCAKAKELIKKLEEAGLSGAAFDKMGSKLNKYDFKGALQLLDELSV